MHPDKSSAVVTGLGSVSCVGASAPALFEASRSGRTGIQADGLGPLSEEVLRELARRFPEAALVSKSTLIGVAAIHEAMTQAGWTRLNPDDGFILATTVGQVQLWESKLMDFMRGALPAEELSPALIHQSLGALQESLSKLLHFNGRSLLLTSACSAATQAIGPGALWIQQGRVKRCLVGGVETLCRLTIEGFRSLQLIAPGPCTPFDVNRKGINLSEAAAFLCLENPSLSPKNPLAAITGQGFSTDAYHMAAPQPEGTGSYISMDQALKSAGLRPEDITWIHAHGTGSIANDLAEGTAIQALFKNDPPYVSSTKSIHGHTLGAAGALETALCIQALRENQILKTWGLHEPDPKIHVRHPGENLHKPLRHLLKNTLGFGGNNASLVISAAG